LRSRFEVLRNRWWPAIVGLVEEVIADSTLPGSLLRQMLHYQMQTGGKRLRSILPLLVAESLDCDPGLMVPFGAACEMLHNASLVHDDIQDGDVMRRSHPSIWKKFGTAQAINLGDAMIAYTLLLMHRLEVPATLRDRATGRVFLEMLRVIEGQVEDLQLQGRVDVSLAEYLHMVEGKTSRLFALPLGGAALLCGAPAPVEDALIQAACQIGTLFQVQDDVLNMFGPADPERAGTDVREGKRTLLVVHCLQAGASCDVDRLLGLLEKPASATTKADIEEAKSIFLQAGSLSFCLSELDRRRNAALASPTLAHYPKLRKLLDDACLMFLEPIAALMPRPLLSAI
jgi:geranylgeranyl diphosphate synthase, type I